VTSRRVRVHGVTLGLLIVACVAVPALAVEIGPGDNLQAYVNALQPGDELVLRGGTYTLSSRFSIQRQGTAAQPITIRAKAGEVPVMTYVSGGQNVINVENARYLILRRLEVRGGSHGIRINASSFITVEDCHIHDTGDVALSANINGSTYQGLRLLRNHIHDTNGTGEGMYLGCNNNACQMFDSLIEGNYIHHTNGPTVEQGDGIEIKEGSYNNVVRDNVIHDTNYPCILTYSTVGNGAPNLIERNVLWNCGDHGIQAAADAVIRNNIILSALVDGIRHQPHQAGTPNNLVVVHNTVIKASGNAIRATGITGSLLIANNALFAMSGPAIRVDGALGQLVVAGNAGTGTLVGLSGGFDASGNIATAFVSASYSGAPPQNLLPAPGSLLVGAGNPAYTVADDFNGIPRHDTRDIGAYRYLAEGDPGWPLQGAFKVLEGIFADGFDTVP
jgi:hypothetical protein